VEGENLNEREYKKLVLAVNELKIGILKHLKETTLKRLEKDPSFPKKELQQLKKLNLREFAIEMYNHPEGLGEILKYLQYQRELLRNQGGVFALIDGYPDKSVVYSNIRAYQKRSSGDPDVILVEPKDVRDSRRISLIRLKYLFYDIEEILAADMDITLRKVVVPVNVVLDFEQDKILISNSQKINRILENLEKYFDIESKGFKEYSDMSPREVNSGYTEFLKDLLAKLEDLSSIIEPDGGPLLTVERVKVDVSESNEYRGIRSISLKGGGISRENADEDFVGIFNHRKLQEILRSGGRIEEITGTLAHIHEPDIIKRYKYTVGITRGIYPKFVISRNYAPDWENVEQELRMYRRVYSSLKEIFERHFSI